MKKGAPFITFHDRPWRFDLRRYRLKGLQFRSPEELENAICSLVFIKGLPYCTLKRKLILVIPARAFKQFQRTQIRLKKRCPDLRFQYKQMDVSHRQIRGRRVHAWLVEGTIRLRGTPKRRRTVH